MAAGDLNYSGAISLSTYMDTDLNSLASATTNVGATILDNTSNEHVNLVAEFYLASVDLSAQTNPTVELYLIPSADGTNYADTGTDASTTVLPSSKYLCGVFGFTPGTGAATHRSVIQMTDYMMNLKYTPVVINKLGVAMASSGNTLKIGTNTFNVAQS